MINVSVFDDMTLCTDQEVKRMIPQVPEPRRSDALKFKHTFGRFACLKAYLMLANLLHSEFGLDEFRMETGEHGKPYIADRPDIHFSISHCQKAIAVVVSNQPVGIDVESFRRFSDGLLDKTMNADEKAAILSSDVPEEKFAALWTCKEAVFKMQGTGITDNLHNILSGGVTTGTKLNLEKGYALSVAW